MTHNFHSRISPVRAHVPGKRTANGRRGRGAALAAILSLSGALACAQYSDGKVRIGVLDDMSGTFTDQTGAGTILAARLAVADFGGRLRGNPIEVVSGDHQNKSDIAANAARKWFDVDQVDMVVGLSNSSVAIAVQQIAREKGKVSIVTGAGAVALTGKECSPTGFHWVWDTYAVAKGASVGNPDSASSWFFITADYAFGHALEADMVRGVKEAGGSIAGSVKAPMATPDYASFILQAKSSKAKVIGLATGGGDLINAIKQAREFGVVAGGQKLVSPLMFITDVHSLGLRTAAGLTSTTAFYWDLNDETRAWSQRFFKERRAMPTMAQAGVYSAVAHFLKASDAAGTDDGKQVAQKMRDLPVNDFMTKDGVVRADGRVLRDMYRVEVKQPSESKAPWDYYKVLSRLPAATAFRPLTEGGCPLVGAKTT
jgi:branched-chain amino acid transport system substrate-binding protein